MKNALLTLFLIINPMSFAQEKSSRSLKSINHSIRVDHARELLGPWYRNSLVYRFEQHHDLERSVLRSVSKRLPQKFKSQATRITETIITEAEKYALDPYFVMAVISGESNFNPHAQGPVGEIGMMQIRHATAKWVAEKMKLPWRGRRTLFDPITNIKIGTAYLSWLRLEFKNQGQLYLAAYNMGAQNVKNALSKKIWPKKYPRYVMKKYLSFYQEI